MLVEYPPPDISAVGTEEDWVAQELRALNGSVGQARTFRSSPLRRLKLGWSHLGPDAVMTLTRQLRALSGPVSKAHIYAPFPKPEEVPVGTGDGTKTFWRVGLTEVDLSLLTPSVLFGTTEQPSSEWGIGWENLLPSSEDLGDTAKWFALSGATVTRTGGQTAPDGSATAWRIQTSGGTTINKLDNIGYGGTSLPANWRVYMSIWIRNLSTSKSVIVSFRGFTDLATVPPNTPWTLYTGVCVQTVSFPPGIRFMSSSAADSLDFLVWRPMIVAFTPDGSMVPSKEWGDAMGYVPTPTGQYIAGDTTLKRWTLAFRTAPASGTQIKLRAYGKRLLWGRFANVLEARSEIPGYVTLLTQFEGDEATGDET